KLSGADVHTLARYPEPLAPATAARRAGLPPVTPRQVAEFVRTLSNDLVIIEGAGGLLVRFDEEGGTILDVAALLKAPMIVVARAGLGTLNHTALSLEALAARGLPVAAVLLSRSTPARDPSERDNAAFLAERHGVRVLGPVPYLLQPVRRHAAFRAALAPLVVADRARAR
ncbi:MAG: dethiobiotin synthase, partial [Cystobacter sp.]